VDPPKLELAEKPRSGPKILEKTQAKNPRPLGPPVCSRGPRRVEKLRPRRRPGFGWQSVNGLFLGAYVLASVSTRF
jgi:hypothetical protein